MMFDQRGSDRYEFPDQKVEYTFGHFSSDEIYVADLINANEIGLCMLSAQRLTVGQEITLINFMSFSARTAVVIWIEDEETGGFNESHNVIFRVGLKFSD